MPQSSQRRQSLPELAKNVPGLNKLKDLLGYFNTTGKRDLEFLKGARNYVTTYKSRRGVTGSSLNRWKNERHRKILKEMVDHFLDRDGHGSLYWPDDSSSKFYGHFQYSKDSSYLRVILNQFFFRMNHQAKNRKAKKKRVQTVPDYSLSTTRSIHAVNPRRVNNSTERPERGEQAQTGHMERANVNTTHDASTANPRAEVEEFTRASFGLPPDVERHNPSSSSISPLTTPASSPILGCRHFEPINRDRNREDHLLEQAPHSTARVQVHGDTSTGTSASSSDESEGCSASRLGDRPNRTSSANFQHGQGSHHSVPYRESEFRRPDVLASVESDSDMLPPNALRASIAGMSWNGPKRVRHGDFDHTARASHVETRPTEGGYGMLGVPMRESSVCPDHMQGCQTRSQPMFATPDTSSSSFYPAQGFRPSSSTLPVSRGDTMLRPESSGNSAETNLNYSYRLYVRPKPNEIKYWPLSGSFDDKSLEVLVGDLKFFFHPGGRVKYRLLNFTLLDNDTFYYDHVELDKPDDFLCVKNYFHFVVRDLLRRNPQRSRTFHMELQLK